MSFEEAFSEEEITRLRLFSSAYVDVFHYSLNDGFSPNNAALILFGVMKAVLQREEVDGARLARGMAEQLINLVDELED